MSVPNDVTALDSLNHLRESFNESLGVMRTLSANAEYKSRGNSIFVDFVGGWKGTPFKVYFNGVMPYGTQVVPGGRSAFASVNEDIQRGRFEAFDVVSNPVTPHSVAAFHSEDFSTDQFIIGAHISPGWMNSSAGEELSAEVRIRIPSTSSNTYTIGFFGNPTGAQHPVLTGALDDTAPAHSDFIGVWASDALGHTEWRQRIRSGGSTTLEATMASAPYDDQFITIKIHKPLGSNTFEFFANGVSQGTGTGPATSQPYTFAILCGSAGAAFEVDYVKIDHDLNAAERP